MFLKQQKLQLGGAEIDVQAPRDSKQWQDDQTLIAVEETQ